MSRKKSQCSRSTKPSKPSLATIVLAGAVVLYLAGCSPAAQQSPQPTIGAATSVQQSADVLPSATITDTPQQSATAIEVPATATQPTTATWYTVRTSNLRSCPHTTCSMVGSLSVGSPVKVVGEATGGNVAGSTVWEQLDYNGKTAYIHSSLVTSQQPAPIVIVQATRTPAPVINQPTPIIVSQPTAAPVQVSNHPANTSGKCNDGTYTDAAHKQGACSHHQGVAEWWGN